MYAFLHLTNYCGVYLLFWSMHAFHVWSIYISICFFINEQVSIISSRQTPVWLCTISMMYEYTCMRINRTCKYILRMSACAHTNKHTWVHACSHHKKKGPCMLSFLLMKCMYTYHVIQKKYTKGVWGHTFFRTIWGHTFLEQYEPILVYFQKYT